ncbi:MAG: hypothetical protein ACRYG7_08265 [Janthinobacterium lividum]
MHPVQWTITSARPGQGGVLGLRVEDAHGSDAPWPYFFTGIAAHRYPQAIEAVTAEVGVGGEATGVTFPGDLDEGDLQERAAIPADEVEVYLHQGGSTQLPRTTFYAILQAFAERLLEQPGQPLAWYEALRNALSKLQAKQAIDNR